MSRTQIKDGVEEKQIYFLSDLSNGQEIDDLLVEYEAKLLPCTHCGRRNPAIKYAYKPSRGIDPHRLYVDCCLQNMVDGTLPNACGRRTDYWFAEEDDDHAELRWSLDFMVQKWNDRPDNTQAFFRTREEALAFLENCKRELLAGN